MKVNDNRRAIMCRRAVRVNSQLKSHKRFANAFLTYCQLVDNARLYCTNALEGPPKVHLLSLLLVYISSFLSNVKNLHAYLNSTQECYIPCMKLRNQTKPMYLQTST